MMTELFGWLVAGTFIGCVIIYGWPIFLLVAVVAFIGWCIGKAIEHIDGQASAARKSRDELVSRADRQHAQIMSGDEIGGTYGIYQPPRGLR